MTIGKTRKGIAALAAVATLATGMVFSTGSAFAADGGVTTVTPNPWYQNGPFEGWGTSLAWFANATGNYGEPGSITTSSGDAKADAKALEYGKQLREQFYQSIFGKDGLNLNMARYNIGGGNASDVAYGYPFMRQGAAVPGTWKDDPDATGVYKDSSGNAVSTKQADREKLDEAFDPNDDSQYDFSKAKAQEWWVKRGAETGDITHWEAFANSAPYFMTNSGYATGSYNAADNNLKDATKFAQYLAKNAKHLEDTYGINVNTVEPMNESETNYWPTPTGLASDYAKGNDANAELINRYAQREYKDKDLSVTPYTTALKKPQEGMAISKAQQLPLINALNQALKDNNLGDDTVVSSTDASVQSQFVSSYNYWLKNDPSIVSEKKVGQYNVHSYGADTPRQVRDIAQGDSTKLSMSEVDGSWQSGGFNPYGFDNALGITGKISTDIYNLQSQDWTFWQVVEDLYNMQNGTKDSNGNTLNPAGENTNWGTVFIDFDCTVAGKDGKLYSQRRVDNNGGKTDGITPCKVLVNSKYNGVRAYTQFVHEGDKIIANNATGNTLTAESKDGKTQTVIHTNTSSKAQTFVIDLSKYGNIASNAAGTLYLTTASSDEDTAKGADYATPEVLNKTSNVKQAADSVKIDATAKTATVTIPARSIASIQLTGVTGVAKDAAAVEDGGTYQIVGKQSGKAVSSTASGDSALSLANLATNSDSAKKQAWKFTKIDMSGTARSTLNAYVIQNAEGKVLVSKNGTNALSDESLDEAKNDASARWIINTEDGVYWQLTNAAAKQSLDVNGSGTAAGTKIGLYNSSAGSNQMFSFRSTTPTGIKSANVQTAVGVVPTLPTTVTPYYSWGTGSAATVEWHAKNLADQVKTEGTYTITGTATNEFGTQFDVTATLYVGDLTVADPVSVTTLAGSTLDEVQSQVEQQTVYAHVKASDAIAIDNGKVTWNWDGIADKLAKAKAGDSVEVPGTVDLGNGKTAKTTLTVYLTSAVPVNVADTGSNLTVNVQQQQYSKGDNWKKLTDGDTAGEAWVTWGESGDAAKTPTATVNFGSTKREVSKATITYLSSTPASVKAEYTVDGTTWKQLGETVDNPSGTITFTTKDGKPVEATQVRIVNTVANGGYMNASEVEVYATPISGSVPACQVGTGTLNYWEWMKNNPSDSTMNSYVSKLCDGEKSPQKGWSTWKSSDLTADQQQAQLNPTATFTFDRTRTIKGVTVYYGKDGDAEKLPGKTIVEYQDANGDWQKLGETDNPSATTEITANQPVEAQAVRIQNPNKDGDAGNYIVVSEIEIDQVADAQAQPASDATLGDLRLDGETISGFNGSKDEYTVNLPVSAESNPKVQAFAKDTAAKVTVKQEGGEHGLGGKAVITITSADGTQTKTVTVNFNAATLTGLKLSGPTKTEYKLNERLDLDGLTVTAVYKAGDKTEEVPVKLDDPQLAISGFDASAAGKQTITVSYRGVSATFTVTVAGNPAQPTVKPSDDRNNAGTAGASGTNDASGNGLSATGSDTAAVAVLIAALVIVAGAMMALRRRRA